MSEPAADPRRPRATVQLAAKRARENVCETLAREGFIVTPLVEADDVLRGFTDLRPDIVLLDLDHELALAVCGELAAFAPEKRARIVLVRDGAIDEARVAKAFSAGADEVLDVRRIGELRARVGAQLRQKRPSMRGATPPPRSVRTGGSRSIDPIARLCDRRAVEMAMDRMVAACEPFALLIFEIDKLARIEADLGPDAAEAAIRAAGKYLCAHARKADTCGRTGAHELTLLVPAVERADVAKIAERHHKALGALSVPELRGRKLTTSVGVAPFDLASPDSSPAALERRARAALNLSLRNGRDRISVSPLITKPPEEEMIIVSYAAAAHPSAALEAVADPIETELLERLSRDTTWLPVLPEACEQALALGSDPTVDLAHLASLVDRDPGVAARFLSAANTAYYSRGERVTTTLAAVVKLGLSATRDLLFQMVCESTSRGLPRFRAEVARSFERSVVTAQACRLIARDLDINVEYSYLAGLLHDIGEARVYRALAMCHGKPSEERARVLVARYHAHAGAELSAAWNLPEEIKEACELHHESIKGRGAPVRHVIVADVVAMLVLSGRSVLRLTDEERECVDAVRVRPDQLEGWITAVRRASGRTTKGAAA